MKKTLNIALLVSFIVTILVPLTGVHIHKLASVIFLVLILVHGVVYRKKLGMKRWLLAAMVVISFVTGIIGMIMEEYPMILMMHRGISIAIVFFTAIHIYVYRKKFK